LIYNLNLFLQSQGPPGIKGDPGFPGANGLPSYGLKGKKTNNS
jgi:hypothetical protein